MGILAADLSESGTVGVIGPVEAGEPVDFITGFISGVEAGGASATSNYIGSFSDVALATEAANSFISNGADVLTGTSQAMVGAVGAAQEAGALWFATQSNQTELAPDTVVASQVYHWEGILGEIIDGIAGGTLGGEMLEINLENEGIVMEFNDDVAIDDAEAAKALLDETVAGIVSGEIDTGAG
jgi:basic membrane protein A